MTKESESVSPFDLTKEPFAGAVIAGNATLADGGSKADAARAMFPLLKDQPRDHAVAAFIAGAGLTDKGARDVLVQLQAQGGKAGSHEVTADDGGFARELEELVHAVPGGREDLHTVLPNYRPQDCGEDGG